MTRTQARSRKRARHVPLEQTTFQRKIWRDSPDHIFLFDAGGRYRRLSGKITRAERAAEYLTTDVWKRWGVSTEAIERFNRQREHVFATGQSIIDEATRQTVGSLRTYEYVLSPLFDERGRVHTVIAAVRDATDRKRSEDGLRFLAEASKVLDSSLDYATTLTNIARLAVSYMADACVVHVRERDGSINQIASVYTDHDTERRGLALRELYRYSSEGTFGVPVVLRSGKPVLYRTITDEHIRSFTTNEEQMERMRQLMPRSAMVVPLVAHGEIHGTLTFALSTSARHYDTADLRLAEELAHRAALAVANSQLYEEAQQAIRMRDDFCSITSHELRSPLTVLQLQIDAMLRNVHSANGQTLPPELLASKLETSKRQVRRLSRLLDDLLDVSQIASGHLDLELEDVNLGNIVLEVVAASEEQAAAARSKIQTHVQPQVIGHWDRARMEQVVTNLVSNAIKYSNARPIDIYVRADTSTATLMVRDNGIGIPPEDLDRIFDRFERATSSHGYEGMGVGLYIVRRIVEAFGGTIDVVSVPGEGSTFTATFPLRSATVPVQPLNAA